MKRMKRHKVKNEKPEASSSFTKEHEEHDLAYYIHDRVELMHQVFSSLKYKELKSMAPECVRHLSIDDLQELCTEELLGISSKRLCAILDGAEPPSDTESSSRSPSPPLETISLDSISSDDEILSETSRSSKKKKHKHKHSKDKSKKEKRKSKEPQLEEDVERSKASRAGLTVLELLELQARARAIRAQLQNEQATKQTSESARPESTHSSDNEVEIKEEPAEVVEISSEDEKPNIKKLEKETEKAQEAAKSSQPEQESVVKRINDLVITIPQSKQTRKIKLNRSKVPANIDITGSTKENTASNNDKNIEKNKNATAIVNVAENDKSKSKEAVNNVGSTKGNDTNVASKVANIEKTSDKATRVTKLKNKAKKKKKEKKLSIEEDHDEITLQLSDSEKMDLLEDLDRKNFENVSSSCTEDTESSSDTSDDAEPSLETENREKRSSNDEEKVNAVHNKEKEIISKEKDTKIKETNESKNMDVDVSIENEGINKGSNEVNSTVVTRKDPKNQNTDCPKKSIDNSGQIKEINTNDIQNNDVQLQAEKSNIVTHREYVNEGIEVNNVEKESDANEHSNSNDTVKNGQTDIIDMESTYNKNVNSNATNIEDTKNDRNAKAKMNNETEKDNGFNSNIDETSVSKDPSIPGVKNTEPNVTNSSEADSNTNDNGVKIKDIPKDFSTKEDSNINAKESKQLSDGEITDNESSEIEVTDLKPEVVCISDEDGSKKKKKKKDKKKKKSKKSDFREGSDQNFFKDKSVDSAVSISTDNLNATDNISRKEIEIVDLDNDNTITDNTQQNKDVTIIDTIDNGSISDIDNKGSKENNYIIIEDEILILSDDSSCYEVDTYLSKEPTAEEIEALSLKIDEINRNEIVSEREIREHEERLREKERLDLDDEGEHNTENSTQKIEDVNTFDGERDGNDSKLERMSDIENIIDTIEEADISWKERYLGSKKVKNVLSTANIFNALRKKNIELKKKLEEKKKEEELKKSEQERESTNKEELVVGSIEHYNTLQGSTKYVDPIKPVKEKETKEETEGVTREMKRDAKQLLKMYKKLLKYNDMNRVKDPSKKKKKMKDK